MPNNCCGLLLVGLLVANAGGSGAAPVEIRALELPGGLRLEAANSQSWPVTVTVDVERDNLVADRPLPLTTTVPASGEKTLVELRQEDPAADWSYRYRWRWIEGSSEAAHDDERAYELPYPAGFAFVAHGGCRTGSAPRERHGVEWPMPEATPVSTARGGQVIRVDRADDGIDALRVWVLHDDGTIGAYRPLASEGIRVAVGDTVKPGEVLGLSDTGDSSGQLRLCFEVFRAADGARLEVIPVRFVTQESGTVRLDAGRRYMRPPRRPIAVARNAIRDVVTCRGVGPAGPIEETWRFREREVVHVHLSIGVPDVYAIRVEFAREGEAGPAAVREVHTGADWTGAWVAFDLAGVDGAAGEWTARAFIGEHAIEDLEFRVEADP